MKKTNKNKFPLNPVKANLNEPHSSPSTPTHKDNHNHNDIIRNGVACKHPVGNKLITSQLIIDENFFKQT